MGRENKKYAIFRSNVTRTAFPHGRGWRERHSHVKFEAAKKGAQKLEAKSKAVDFKALLMMEPDSGVTKGAGLSIGPNRLSDGTSHGLSRRLSFTNAVKRSNDLMSAAVSAA